MVVNSSRVYGKTPELRRKGVSKRVGFITQMEGKSSPKLPYPRPLDYGVGSQEEDCEGLYSHANVLAMNSGNVHP